MEHTFNRYYLNDLIMDDNLSVIDTNYVCDWLHRKVLERGGVSQKEFARILHIMRGVLVYSLDLCIGNACLIDWGHVSRYMPSNFITNDACVGYAVSDDIVKILYRNIVDVPIYPVKQSACLCLLANFYLGLRVGELASLKWSDVDFEHHFIRIYKTEVKSFERDQYGQRTGTMVYTVKDTTKTQSSFRRIPITADSYFLLQLLKYHHNNRGYSDNEYLAYDGVPSGILVRSLDRTLRRLCKLIEIPHFSTHYIRKTFASKLHDLGVSSRDIADLLGHVDIQTTEKYYVLSYEHRVPELLLALDGKLIY